MNSDVSFNDSEPGPAASMPGDSSRLPAAVPPGRARGITSREYRARMVVTHRGARWEIDAVEFWERDQKLTLHALDGPDAGHRREVWAAAVTFTDEVVPLAETPPATGGHEQ